MRNGMCNGLEDPCLGVDYHILILDCDISAFAIQVTSCRLVEYTAIEERDGLKPGGMETKTRENFGCNTAPFPWESDCDCLEIGDF